ncbi:hypothetical protein LIER_09388 [Lithospermum erythrorhizon]|uniref:Uncharacterized protein n=1 Tax=Lithospermum erythrorhizon TaxID=34254 RepID=A0AAV3PHF5_LITER
MNDEEFICHHCLIYDLHAALLYRSSATLTIAPRDLGSFLGFEILERSCIITRLGQSVTFPSASKSCGPYKGYSDWQDSIFSTESIRSVPLGPGKGKSVPRLPIPPVPLSSKPLKNHSLLEDDLVDRDPKHVTWGSTRRPGPVVVSSPNTPVVVTKDVEATPVIVFLLLSSSAYVIFFIDLSFLSQLSEIVPSSGDEAQTEVVDIQELSDCMIMEAADIEVHAASLPTGVQHIESILRDNLKLAWVDLCSLEKANDTRLF